MFALLLTWYLHFPWIFFLTVFFCFLKPTCLPIAKTWIFPGTFSHLQFVGHLGIPVFLKPTCLPIAKTLPLPSMSTPTSFNIPCTSLLGGNVNHHDVTLVISFPPLDSIVVVSIVELILPVVVEGECSQLLCGTWDHHPTLNSRKPLTNITTCNHFCPKSPWQASIKHPAIWVSLKATVPILRHWFFEPPDNQYHHFLSGCSKIPLPSGYLWKQPYLSSEVGLVSLQTTRLSPEERTATRI